MLDPEAPLAEPGGRLNPPSDAPSPPYPMAARAVRNSLLLSRICAFVVVLIGALVLVGWALGLEVLKTPIPGEVTMKANTALSFVLAGCSLLLALSARKGTVPYRVGQFFAGATAAIGSFTLAEFVFRLDLGIDQLLVSEPANAVATSSPGRMAPSSALCFLLFGSALLLLGRRKGPALAQALGGIGAFVGTLGLIPFVYGAPASSGILAGQSHMAVHTAAGTWVLGIGLLLARPDEGVMAIIHSDTSAGTSIRRLLPVAVLTPLLVGGLAIVFGRTGLYDIRFEGPLVAVVSATGVGLLIRVASTPSLNADLRRKQAERERADLFSMNPSPTLLIRVSDRCFVDVNDAFARTFGYTRDEVIGRTALDLNLWQDPQARDVLLGLLRERGTVDGYVGDLQDREGRPISMLATLRLVEIDGEPHILGNFQDISALRRAEEEVRRSGRRLETLHAIGRAILAAQSTEEIGRVGLSLLRERVACTRATLARFDPASQDLEVVALVTDDETEVRLGARFPLSAVGQLDALLRGETHRIPDTLEIEDPSFSVQRLIEEGVRAYVNIPLVTAGELIGTLNLTRAAPGGFGEDDLQTVREVADLLAVAVVQSDLRDELQRRAGDLEHRVAERTAALAESETRFRSVLANSPDATLLIDPTGAIELANGAAATLFGYETIELLGMSVEALVPESSRANHRAYHERYLTEAVVRPLGTGLPLRARRKDGSEFAADISLSPIRIEAQGRPSVIAIVRDVSERHRAEEEILAAKQEAERANRAKDDFLSRMSHELRTPMNAVLGFAQLMQMNMKDGPDAESVKQILRAGRHLLGLIDEVLDISRVDAGTIAVSLEPVGISAVVVETEDLVRPMANERGVSIHVEEVNDLHVLADRRRLSQVLINLLSNAVKYNREGGEVRVSWAKGGEGRLRIGVTDTGSGIDADEQHLLFVPFERLGAGHSEVEGTGLGLALSKRLVEAMGGTIDLESEVGRGSVFTVELALAEPPVDRYERQPVDAVVSTPPTGLDGATPHQERMILYIEDNLSNLALVERILKDRTGVRLLFAMQGQVGLDLARQHVPDLILLDLHLPDLPGETVLRRLREDDMTARIPVAVISADATPGQMKRLLAMGADEYLTKPLNLTAFLAVVDRSLSPDREP